MSKIAVVYWSGTGNTEAMAKAVLEGIGQNGGQGELFTSAEFNDGMMDSFAAVAFGCPSMGAEELEAGEFAPVFDACEPKLKGKKIALFGSYGWGSGEWMRTWEQRCRKAGAILSCDPVICNEMPDDKGLAACKQLGRSLV